MVVGYSCNYSYSDITLSANELKINVEMVGLVEKKVWFDVLTVLLEATVIRSLLRISNQSQTSALPK